MGFVGDAVKSIGGGLVGGLGGGIMDGFGFMGNHPAGGHAWLSGGNTPQDKGYGIAPSPSFQQYQTPGLQSPQGGYPQQGGQPATWANGEVKSNPNMGAMDLVSGMGANMNQYFSPKFANTMNQMIQPQAPAQQQPMPGQMQQQSAQAFAGATRMPSPGSGGLAQAPQGWDFASPGVMEQTFDNQQGRFFAPSQANEFVQQNQGTFTSPGAGEQYWKNASQNFGRAGAGEQWFDQNAKAFAAPGAGEQYWNQVQGGMNQPTASSQAWGMFNQMPAGLGEYYDRAKTRTAGTLNDQLAARGAYGSSYGLNAQGDAMAALDAERANREGDFALRQAQTGANIAQGADAAKMAQLQGYGNVAGMAAGDALNRLTAGGNFANQAQTLGTNRIVQGSNLANAAQTMGMNRVSQGASLNQMGQADDTQRLLAGMNAAQMAQEARRQRGRDYMGDVYAPAADMARYTNENMNAALMNDQALMDSSLAFQTGLAADAVNAGYRNAEKQKADASWGMGMLSSMFGMM